MPLHLLIVLCSCVVARLVYLKRNLKRPATHHLDMPVSADIKLPGKGEGRRCSLQMTSSADSRSGGLIHSSLPHAHDLQFYVLGRQLSDLQEVVRSSRNEANGFVTLVNGSLYTYDLAFSNRDQTQRQFTEYARHNFHWLKQRCTELSNSINRLINRLIT
jgi:hypothetical protein